MATHSLVIKDGNGSISRLSANSSSTGLIPEHAVSGTVTVSSSISNPVYVTGSVTVNQPVNVDLVLNDTLTASVTLSSVNSGFTEGAGVGKTALLVYLTGSSGNNINIDGVTPIDGKLQITSSAASPIYTTGLLNITNSSGNPVLAKISNQFIDDVLTAVSYSYAPESGGSLKVKLTGSNVIKEGGYDILLVRGTGSQTSINNTGFQQLINYITAATDLGNNDYRLKVITTGSGGVTIENAIGNPANVKLSDVNTYGLGVGGSALVVKITGSSNSDAVFITGTTDIGISKYGYSEGQALIVKTTSSVVALDGISTIISSLPTQATGVAVALIGQENLVKLYNSTSSVTSSQTNPLYVTGITAVTASYTNPVYITGTVLIDNGLRVTSSKDQPLYVISENDKPIYIANSSSNALFITASTSFPLQVQKRSGVAFQTQRYVANVFGFDWTVNSGTFVMATPDTNRKSLIISNPSENELYIAIGSSSDAGFVNGFFLSNTQSAPETYAFIIYPSGTYTADEYAASLFHAGFYISQSVNNQKALVTRIGY